MPASAKKPRPLSPHLQIYKPQITSILSIFHRASGVFLSIGSPLLVYWLWSVAAGPEAYAEAQECFSAWYMQILMFFWTAAFFYHLSNGIRHLFWDMGKGFDMENLQKSGYAVLISAGVLTILTWLVARVF